MASETGWLDKFITSQGSEGLRKLNMGMAIGGTLISGFESFLAAEEHNEYQKNWKFLTSELFWIFYSHFF